MKHPAWGTVLMATSCRLESVEICAEFVSRQGLWHPERHAHPQGHEDPRRLPRVQCGRPAEVSSASCLPIDSVQVLTWSDAEPPTRLAAPPPAPAAVISSSPTSPRPQPAVASSTSTSKASPSAVPAKLLILFRTPLPIRLAPPPTSPMARNVSSGAPTSPSRSPPSRSASSSATSNAAIACAWTRSLLLLARAKSWCTWT